MICYVKDTPIYYEVYGEGKPILCIHGYIVDHRLMSGCLEPIFADSDYQRIYVDLPGMGKTPASDTIRNADEMLALITAFIDEVIPHDNFLVIGESYGGYLAQGLVYTLGSRIDGVTFICPLVTERTPMSKLPAKATIFEEEGLREKIGQAEFDDFLNMAVIATTESYEKYESDILSGVKLADFEYLDTYKKEGYYFSFAEELKKILYNKPACILTGRQDHVVGYTDAFQMLDQFPRATFSVLDCAGHNLQIENIPLFNEHIKEWIRRVEL